jgi:hypothetical protein
MANAQNGKQQQESEVCMRKTKTSNASKIRALKRMKDSEIDTTDIPPTADWGKGCRPLPPADQEAGHD